jgi:hypothetical protein
MSAACIASPATRIAVTGASIAYATAVAYTTAIPGSTVVPTAAIVSAATIVATTSPVSVIPRTGADKDPADEPARTVEAIRSACVGIVVVIAPGTNGSRISVAVIPVPASDANSDTYTYLGVRRSRHQRRGNHQRTEQQQIS